MPCAVAYVPGLIVMAQGRKRVELGPNKFIYDESRYLLTSLDLPSVSQVVEASKERPALAFALKLELPVVREILAREDVPIPEVPPDSLAMTTVRGYSRIAERLLPVDGPARHAAAYSLS